MGFTFNKREVKAHAVCIPCAAQGHINSMLKFAKLLHFKGFHITFVHTQSSYSRILEASGPSSLKGLPDFQFKSIPDGLSASESLANAEDMSKVTHINRFRLSETLRDFLKNLKESAEEPEVTCIVSDTYMSFTLDVSAEFGLPNLSYCSLSACGFMGFFAIKELIDRGIVPLKNEDDLTNGYLDTPVDGVLGLKNMRLRDFSKFVHTTDPNHVLMNFTKDESQDSLKATAILIHTFEELEGATLDAMSVVFPAVYAIGPLDIMCKNISKDSVNIMGSSFWVNNSSCLEWLNKKAPSSIVYVNFGSLTVVTKDQLVEFAWGLINSNCEFLWVIRPDLITKDSSLLPEELLVEVNRRGLIISWCPQQEVLRHPSIGVFLTHCGWNSMMESISCGVPMICWPFFAEQQTNCRYACNEWKIGLEISSNVNRYEVEMRIKEAMEGDEGMKIRRNVMRYKESAGKATVIGGAAFDSLDKVIEDVLMSRSCK